MFGRRVLCGVGVLLAAALAGCGGGSHAAKPDPKAEHARWAGHVDAICLIAAQRITRRGRPATAHAIDDTIAAAARDLDDAVVTIARLPRPPGAQPADDRFVKEMRRLDPLLDDLVAGVDRGRFDAAVGAAEDLATELRVVDEYASDAGVVQCARPNEAHAALEAIFATSHSRDVGALDRRMNQRLKRLSHAPAPATTAAGSRYYERVANVLFRWGDELVKLTDEDDTALGGPTFRYRQAIIAAQTLCRRVAAELAATSVITPARGQALDQRFRRAVKHIDRAHARLAAAIARAQRPLLPDPPGAGAAPGESQVS